MENENTISVEKLDETVENQSSQTKAKRTVKDSVFRNLFENPKYLLQLYQALHPEDTDVTEDQIGSVTIRNILLDQMYNDLGFMVGSKLVLLIEAQSSWSKNILVRILLYLANTWQEYIESHNLNVYGSKKVELPRPELYVIYTGNDKERPEWLSLSEEFFAGQDVFLDVRVKVIYDGKKGDIINQYVAFTKVIDEQVKMHGRTREAVLEMIRICKSRDILAEYLGNREKEVVDIMMTLFEQEKALEHYADEKKAEGVAEGKKEGVLETLCGLVRDGILSMADAAKRAEVNIHDFEKVYKAFML